ncbi:MAG: DNA topoisomerase IV subunit A [Chitinophagales bacterium]|nr:MAG: DNA topoisomerase IV subunit A [Chitinophagales bacterium]
MKGKDKNTYEENSEQYPSSNGNGQLQNVIHVSGMYRDWFLDYASYVILERAVPHIHDGLKPVQRRILHSLYEMDDGRFHKVANVIGNTMKYHPHGDASIGDAIVQLGQRDLLLDLQGNWGNVFTGDSAAAPRYIETRLSKFALEVVFNPKTTEWQASYDGRAKEPVTLPVKFPLVLALGAEGIAVGLACKILPHNFNELIDASIKVLKGKKAKIYPDFVTGGLADFSDYNDGQRGGRIKIRARIKELDKRTLVITEIPYGTTTLSLIDSILKANDKGKIKIKKVEDNTAEQVEIVIHLAPGTSPDKTIDALYAFTDCEVTISPNTCVIENDKPRFLGVSEILQISTQRTLDLLKVELEIKLHELQEQWHFLSLEKIFIEKRIYRDIEQCETWEAVMDAIRKGLKPYTKKLLREVTDEDIIRLTEIRIKRISKYDSQKAEDDLKQLEENLAQTKHHLSNLTDYAIDYFTRLREKYGKGRERKTEIRQMEAINATEVAMENVKLYVNREEGFIGWGLKKDEFIMDCSDIDDIIVFCANGMYKVVKMAEKVFVGKNILHAAVWKKGDERTVYNCVYKDGATGKSFVKRFAVTGVTRDKEYNVTQGSSGSKILYLTANPNAESEIITVKLDSRCAARIKEFEFDFATLEIKGRGAKGNILTKYPIRKIERKATGHSTLGDIQIWHDAAIGRLNTEGRGTLLGNFSGDDRILAIYKDGTFELTNYELTNRYEPDEALIVEKFVPEKPIAAIYFDDRKKNYFVKRFLVETKTLGERFRFIGDSPGSKLILVSTAKNPLVEVTTKRGKETINLEEFIDVKGWKALGNRLSMNVVTNVKLLQEGPWPVREQSNASTENLPTAEQEKTDVPAPDKSATPPSAIPHSNASNKKEAMSKKIKQEKEKIEVGEAIEWDFGKPPAKYTSKTTKNHKKGQGSLF